MAGTRTPPNRGGRTRIEDGTLWCDGGQRAEQSMVIGQIRQQQALERIGGHGVRVDTHAYSGYKIPSNYDSMIAKLIVKAPTRNTAIAKMKRALEEFIIEGVKTTIPYHVQLMNDPNFINGLCTTKYLENSFKFISEDK